jgi:hypothetical protein
VNFKVSYEHVFDSLKIFYYLGIATRCYAGLCQAGVCVDQTIGASVYAYCHCNPGYTGTTCEQCS